jgi:hypothetical protein
VLRYIAMLDDKVIIRFRELMEVDLRPRDKPVRMQVQAADRKWPLSGNALHERGEIGCAELSERAAIIWRGIRRCYAAYQASPPDASLVSDLNKEISYWIRGESQVLTSLADANWAPNQAKSHIPTVVAIRCEELVKKLQNEINFYVDSLMNPKPDEPASITIQNNFGAVAAGTGAQAHAHVEISGNAQLIQSLEQLRTTIEQTDAMPVVQRTEAIEVINDAITTARDPKPNKLKLTGLLKGVGEAVTLIAEAPHAWESVRAAAAVIGVTLP